MLSITMLVPAQELMLWCDMMDMNMIESHEVMSMQMDDMYSQDTEHCDTQDFGASDTSDCDVLIDCNCVSLQSSDIETAVLGSSTIRIEIPLAISLIDLSGFQYSIKIFPPPPVWSFPSYSPPDLFLANESFLI